VESAPGITDDTIEDESEGKDDGIDQDHDNASPLSQYIGLIDISGPALTSLFLSQEEYQVNSYIPVTGKR
jgi:hypothetical protein